MYALSVNQIPDLMPQGGSQCFPFYTYNEDGTNRRENITDWALEQFQAHYKDSTITKWDIFYYTYAVLHHPHYRTRYAANLKGTSKNTNFRGSGYGISVVSGFSGSQYGN